MTLRIYGAGMAGLLAANMLRRHTPVIHEVQPELPHNHAALLRFRTNAVEQATGIPFRRVRVYKAIKSRNMLLTRSTLADANQYALKVSGAVSARSILDLEPVERYIAPGDFVAQLADGVHINYDSPLKDVTEVSGEEPVISTIPMPAMMRMTDWQEGHQSFFRARKIWTARALVTRPSVDVYQTIYYPDPGLPYYRASMTGAILTVEFSAMNVEPSAVLDALDSVVEDFGLSGVLVDIEDPPVVGQPYGKLLPLTPNAEQVRQSFITYLSDRYNVYSLGRFATWRQILLDDVVEDVRHIERFITARSPYTRRLHVQTPSA